MSNERRKCIVCHSTNLKVIKDVILCTSCEYIDANNLPLQEALKKVSNHLKKNKEKKNYNNHMHELQKKNSKKDYLHFQMRVF